MNIILIGYRCSGKTMVGKTLAQRLKRQFVDLDEAVEAQTGSDIKQIVSQKGWSHFRKVERELIQTLAKRDNLVLSSGGGVVMDPLNVNDLKWNGLIIYLEADAKAIRQRMERDHISGNIPPSPNGGEGSIQEIEAVLKERTPLYASVSDITIDTSGQTVEQLVQLIIDHPQVSRHLQS